MKVPAEAKLHKEKNELVKVDEKTEKSAGKKNFVSSLFFAGVLFFNFIPFHFSCILCFKIYRYLVRGGDLFGKLTFRIQVGD